MEPKLRILIVDDDQRMTRTLADILSVAGHEVVEANSGAQALEKVSTQTFDCVLTDVKMPEMNGVELHRQLRLAQPGLPVMLMTAYAADELIRQGLDEGVVGVFDKPLAINQLLAFFTSLAKHRTIVIVDNDPAFCQTLDDILRQRGFKVAQFTDPHVDVELMAAEAQVILLDLHLNHLAGLVGDRLSQRNGRCHPGRAGNQRLCLPVQAAGNSAVAANALRSSTETFEKTAQG
jgi:two-component system response regulator HydG